ncbi:stereocilin [Ramlibacter tataouinensis]|uniref:stereocilin n=1 Tax=Ramlibacter tataouinensis TaxID=94132 RepID=UPI0022F3E3F2|nr:stereocilin [Ramlibacter tataouinensis]WBY01262.1 stereocilin [Ramlibacter tataouinensis]
MATHPVEPEESDEPGTEAGTPNPTRLPVEPEFGPIEPPPEPGEPVGKPPKP